MKVMFIMPKMGVGGIEHVWLKLLKGFTSKGIECRLAVAKAEGKLLEEAKNIVPVDIFSPYSILGFVPGLTNLLKKEKPTHIITAFEDVGFLSFISIKLAGINPIWIHSVHNTHSPEGRPSNIKGKIRYYLENKLAKFYYHYTNKIVAVSNGVKNEIINDYQIPSEKIFTIYNPVITTDMNNFIRNDNQKTQNDTWKLVSIGRLHHQKGYDILIKAAQLLKYSWILEIWGEGDEHNILQEKIRELGLVNKVFLKGYTSTPFEIMKDADIFILSSRHEGLGNVLIEAMASQCQLIAADCKYGPSEILENGKYGKLVSSNDPHSMADAINQTMEGKGFVQYNLLKNQANNFSEKKSIDAWIHILK